MVFRDSEVLGFYCLVLDWVLLGVYWVLEITRATFSGVGVGCKVVLGVGWSNSTKETLLGLEVRES